MSIDEIKSMIREMNLSVEDGLTFKAGVILMFISQTNEFGLQTISEKCGYDYKDVETIMSNLRENKIITDENYFDIDCDDEETNYMEFILISMAGAGEIIRHRTEEKTEYATN